MKPFFTILISCLFFQLAKAQQSAGNIRGGEMISELREKALLTGRKVERQKRKFLSRFKKLEKRISQASGKDSLVLFPMDSLFRPDSLIIGMEGVSGYLSHLDSLATAVKFLSADPQIISSELEELGTAYRQLQSGFSRAGQSVQLLKNRYLQLLEMSDQGNTGRLLKKYHQQLQYYQAQVGAFKDLMNDPSKAEEKLLELVAGMPGFRDFFSRHSQLSSLFTLPGTAGVYLPEGLQTRNSISRVLDQRFGNNYAAGDLMKEQMASAQAGLNAIKNKMQAFVPGIQDEAPGEQALNSQRTKSFRSRLQTEYNFQSVRARQMFPAGSDISVSLGYKLHDRLVAGLGLSCRIGWGRGWNKISVTGEGYGFRSFIDWQLSRKDQSLMISGGYEKNRLRPHAPAQGITWQQTGLIGLTRYQSLSLGNKKAKAVFRFYWNFLSPSDAISPPFIFRIGYAFN